MFWKKKYKSCRFFFFFLAVSISICFLTYPIQAKSNKIDTGRYKIDLNINKVAVFPFSDHSYDSFDAVQHLNKSKEIVESLQNAFERKGISLIDANAVRRLLLAEGVIGIFKQANNPESYEWNIIGSNYFKYTAQTIIDKIIGNYGKTAVLSKSKINFLADLLGADVLVRGVILDKTPRSIIEKDDVIKPAQGFLAKRLIPFFIREKFCYALTENYENGLPPFDYDRPVSFLSFFRPDKKVIEILIFIQNANTGDVVWADSCRVAYRSRGAYHSGDFRKKLQDEIDSTMELFFSSLSKFHGSRVLMEKIK